MFTSWPVRRTTIMCSTTGDRFTASSAMSFRRTILPRIHPPSAVMSTRLCASSMRSASASTLKPPYTTEWMAPILAQASMAMGSSGMRPM